MTSINIRWKCALHSAEAIKFDKYPELFHEGLDDTAYVTGESLTQNIYFIG